MWAVLVLVRKLPKVIIKAMALRFAFLLGLLHVFVSTAHGYPLFFQCDNEGHLQDLDISVDLFKFIKSKDEGNPSNHPDTDYSKPCKDLQNCIKEFEQIASLTNQSEAITQKLLIEEAKKNRDLFAAYQSTGISEFENIMMDTVSCRKSIEQLDTTYGNGRKISMYYPFDTPYMYVTGYRKDKEAMKKQVFAEDIKQIVSKSMAAGVDPYANLALHLMETGSVTRELYLDPAAQFKILGCPVTNGTESSANYQYLGMFFNVQPGTSKNTVFEDRLYKSLIVSGPKPRDVPSKICTQGTKYFNPEKTPPKLNDLNCCLELRFTPVEIDNADYDATLYPFIVNLYLRSEIESELPSRVDSKKNGKDPAFHIQGFNGWTRLMGSTEDVPSWRSGLDYYQDPQYGYQAMDYVLNSLLPNQSIRQIVHEVENEMGLKAPSIMCQNRKPGIFQIDSENYFKKAADSPRMVDIWDAFKKHSKINGGKIDGFFESLPRGYRKVLAKEIEATKEFLARKQLLSDPNTARFQECYLSLSFSGSDDCIMQYFRTFYPQRRTLAQAAMQDLVLEKDPTKDAYQWGRMDDPTVEEIKANVESK